MMKIFANLQGKMNKRKSPVNQESSAKACMQDWQKMGIEIREIERRMENIVQDGVNLTGPEARINRELYRSLAAQKRSLEEQFMSMGSLVSALNSKSMLEREKQFVGQLARQSEALNDPADFERTLDEMEIRREQLNRHSAAINESRIRYESSFQSIDMDQDDEYTRCVAAARARRDAEQAVALTLEKTEPIELAEPVQEGAVEQ